MGHGAWGDSPMDHVGFPRWAMFMGESPPGPWGSSPMGPMSWTWGDLPVDLGSPTCCVLCFICVCVFVVCLSVVNTVLVYA